MASAFQRDKVRMAFSGLIALHSLATCSLYGSGTFSDILIKFSGREIKYHKVVLFQGSDYFKALCGPDSRFAESQQVR